MPVPPAQISLRTYFDRQRTLVLWWNTGAHAAREEAEGVEATAARFVMRAARFLIAELGARQDDADTLQVSLPVIGVKRPRGDHCIGGVADLAEADQWVFPPEAARSGGPRRDD